MDNDKRMRIEKDIDGNLVLIKRNRVLQVSATSTGNIEFREGCDEHFAAVYTPREALAMLEELRVEILAYELRGTSLLK